ncbi:hypothetical protein KC678_01190 [Candidatus Dojkabacteria bacterium]|uniref:DUF1844 domain-containing protein n=1 Tax=Candidatus Dojkabacteria bacterium TaxID=2099670 RepID=A0A955I915_9BACT|nr:hypothetical protein [Candidatus Dojkabacteria bacterium]
MSDQNQTPVQSTANDPNTTVTPDSETVQRIKNLAIVGKAITQIGSGDSSYNTSFFAAKEALLTFKDGIDRLELDPESKEGIHQLIQYLNNKIDKRMKQAEVGGDAVFSE